MADTKQKLTQTKEKLAEKPISWRSQSREMILKREMEKFTKAFKDNFITLMISALGLLVALSWNSFWNTWVSSLVIENTVGYKFYIAIGMTVLAVVLIYVFSRFKDNK